MNVKTEAELYDAIQRAIQGDVTACQYQTDPFSHSFSIKQVRLTDEHLSEMLRRIDAGYRVRTRVPTTLAHCWIDGSESGAEDLSYLHFIEIWRDDCIENSGLSINAARGAFWELIPQGSPGYMEYAPSWATPMLCPSSRLACIHSGRRNEKLR